MTTSSACIPQQRGQAMVEALVALVAIIAMWHAVAWIARLQDLALQAHHAARYGAFAAARQPKNVSHAAPDLRFFTMQRLQWTDTRGRWLLPSIYQEPRWNFTSTTPMPNHAQPGLDHDASRTLRRQWGVEDPGVVVAGITLQPVAEQGNWPRLHREVAIAVDAAHASSDADAAERIRQSSLGWYAAANTSAQRGQQVVSRAQGVDAGWGRPLPEFDWLMPWAGDVPEHVLSSTTP